MLLTGQAKSASNNGFYLFQIMSEEQLKAAEAEATEQVEGAVEEISEEDLEGVDGGALCPSSDDPSLICPS